METISCEVKCVQGCKFLDSAQDPETPPHRLAQLAESSSDVCHFWGDLDSALAGNPSTPAASLLRLAKGDTRTRELVAENPATPSEALEILAEDESPCVRMSVFDNPRTPQDIAARINQSDWESC